MKRFILIAVTAILMAVFVGSVIAESTGLGKTECVGLAIFISCFVAPIVELTVPKKGRLNDVVLKSAFEAELLRSLKTVSGGFLQRVRDRSDLVGNNVLDMVKAGVKPKVLIDNNVYPIPAAQRTDEAIKLPLRKLTTEVTIVTKDELYALPYDKKSSVIQDHKESILEEYHKLTLYNYCPATDTSKTPVLQCTGADDGTGRKRMTRENLVKFRTLLSNLGVGQCEMVLSPEHIEDICLWSQAFENQYHKISEGEVLPMFGFLMHQNVGFAPSFAGGTKKAFGAIEETTDRKATVTFPAGRVIKCLGDVEMFFDEPTARMHQYEVNFEAHVLGLPKDSEGTGAMI